jgi:TolC family type I secretion outer membrane protein
VSPCRIRNAALAGAVAWAGLFGSTPPAAAAPLSLDACVRLALKNNLTVEQARGQLRNASADVTGARAAFLPQLRVGAGFTKPEEFTTFFIEDQILSFNQAWSYSANLDLTLFDGWGNVSGYQGASRARTAARDRLLDAGQGVVFETERRFFEVRKAEALLDVQREAANLSAEQLKKTTAMKDLGAATQADVYKSQVDDANNRLEVLRSERDLEVARASLATYLGLDPREPLELAEEDLDVQADLTLDDALEHALSTNPEIRASRASARAYEAGVTAAKSARWPSINAFYNANYRFGEPDEFKDEYITEVWGLSMNMTVFDGFLTKSRIRRAESDLLTARRTVESAERDVIFAVREAWLDLEIAREAIRVSEEAVRSSEEDRRLADERFKIGEGTILDVIDAQVNLTRSRSSLVNATYDRRLAVSALRDAIGDLPVPQSAE